MQGVVIVYAEFSSSRFSLLSAPSDCRFLNVGELRKETIRGAG